MELHIHLKMVVGALSESYIAIGNSKNNHNDDRFAFSHTGTKGK